MPAKDDIKENVREGMKTVVGVASNMVERVPEDLEKMIRLLEDRNTEIRLKFDEVTLNGDIALSLSLFKKESQKKK